MPNLRRIPRTVRRRPRDSQRQDVARTEPQVAELELGGVRWLNIEAPTAVETAYLAEHFDFHELDLEDVLSTRQRPKIDEYDEYLFMVLHLPRFDKSIGRLNAAELNVFVGPDYVITLPNHPLKPVGRIRTPDSLGYDLRYAAQMPAEDGGRTIVIATDRPIGFSEATNRPITIDYPFTVIDMQIPAKGFGQGTLAIAAKIIPAGKTVIVENFDTQPVQLNRIETRKLKKR